MNIELKKESYTLVVPNGVLQLIIKGIMKLPYEECVPILNGLKKVIDEENNNVPQVQVAEDPQIGGA